MSELFQHRDEFDDVLNQIDKISHDDIAKVCAECHFSVPYLLLLNPVSWLTIFSFDLSDTQNLRIRWR